MAQSTRRLSQLQQSWLCRHQLGAALYLQRALRQQQGETVGARGIHVDIDGADQYLGFCEACLKVFLSIVRRYPLGL